MDLLIQMFGCFYWLLPDIISHFTLITLITQVNLLFASAQSKLSIGEMIFTNIMQDGAESNISAIRRVPGFQYVQRVGWAIVAFS